MQHTGDIEIKYIFFNKNDGNRDANWKFQIALFVCLYAKQETTCRLLLKINVFLPPKPRSEKKTLLEAFLIYLFIFLIFFSKRQYFGRRSRKEQRLQQGDYNYKFLLNKNYLFFLSLVWSANLT